jgi:SAM-dependent methyltransferase
MQPTADSQQYATTPGDARLYGAGYAEFMRRSNVRRNAAASIAALLSDAVQPANAITKILDLGCNDGVMTSMYLSALIQRAFAQELHVTLVDPAAEALGQAAALITGLSARVQTSCVPTTAESFVQMREEKFDVIMALWVFYHIKPEVIVRLLGMLAQRGLLIVAMGSPIHPIKSYGTLAHLSRHGDSLPVETFLGTARSRGMLTFERLTIPTCIELNGLWEKGDGATEAGKAFFSFLFNRDLASFPPDSQHELDTLLAGILRDQAGIVSHDHFVYVVRSVHERRLTTDAKPRCQEPCLSRGAGRGTAG